MRNKYVVLDIGEESIVSEVNEEDRSISALRNRDQVAYKESGLSMMVENERVKSVFLCFDPGYHEYQAFVGCIKRNGETLELCAETSPDYVVGVFGAPDEHWSDGVDECIRFSQPNVEYEFVWSMAAEGNKLTYLIIDQIHSGE